MPAHRCLQVLDWSAVWRETRTALSQRPGPDRKWPIAAPLQTGLEPSEPLGRATLPTDRSRSTYGVVDHRAPERAVPRPGPRAFPGSRAARALEQWSIPGRVVVRWR